MDSLIYEELIISLKGSSPHDRRKLFQENVYFIELSLGHLISILQNYDTYICIWLSLNPLFQIFFRGFGNERLNKKLIKEIFTNIRIQILQIDMLNNIRQRDHIQIKQFIKVIVG